MLLQILNEQLTDMNMLFNWSALISISIIINRNGLGGADRKSKKPIHLLLETGKNYYVCLPTKPRTFLRRSYSKIFLATCVTHTSGNNSIYCKYISNLLPASLAFDRKYVMSRHVD